MMKKKKKRKRVRTKDRLEERSRHLAVPVYRELETPGGQRVMKYYAAESLAPSARL
jgi:hypothetical protein